MTTKPKSGSHTNTGNQTLEEVKLLLCHLLERVDSLEHYSNQQSILLDTLGTIMKEIENQEQLDNMSTIMDENT